MKAEAETRRPVTEATIREWAARYNGRGAPRLADLCAFINARFPHYEARMERWSYSPDIRPRGSRVRTRDGVTREGKRLVVTVRGQPWERVFEHFPGEPYRHNSRVCDWIVRKLDEASDAR